MQETRLEHLFQLYLLKRATELEEIELFELLADPAKKAVSEKLLDAFFVQQEADTDMDKNESQEILLTILQAGSPSMNKPVTHRVHFLRKWWWAAASVACLIGIGGYLYTIDKKDTENNKLPSSAIAIQPGMDGAVLTLADGSQVSLDSIQNKVLALQGGVVAKIVNGMLIYEGGGKEAVFNTVSTPIGRKYQVTLPDSTKVWLNAASSIRYPTVFTGNERMVEITGEAYLEVARNKEQPFKLRVNNKAEILVLGTAFNVNAYDNEPSINTTLLEGSIRVKTAGIAQRILKPGQQAMISNSGAQEEMSIVDNVPIDKVLAWKNGLFNFEGLSVKEILRQAERWYDIKVVYQDGFSDASEFTGKLTRDISLTQFMESLSDLGIQYKMEGRTVLILSAKR